jgi:hypothetical protein
LLLSCCLISGCASIMPDFADMSESYQAAIEKQSNGNLLLNVVRASKKMPLSFVEIPNITGTGSLTTSPALAGTFINIPAQSTIAPSFSMAVGRTFTFTQASIENAEFTKQFILPIPVETINYFTRDNYIPDEVIFSLVVESIGIRTPDNQLKTYTNDPTEPDYPEFRDLLQRFVDFGLTTELVSVESPIGPPLDSSKLTESVFQFITAMASAGSAGSTLQNVTLKEISKKDSVYQVVRAKMVGRACFEANSYEEDVRERFGSTYFCIAGSGENATRVPGSGDTEDVASATSETKNEKNKSSISIRLRSNREIFNYLGLVLATQKGNNVNRVMMRAPQKKGESQTKEPYLPLLVVHSNPPAKEKSLSSVQYDGVTYSIPADDNGYSNEVLIILSHLVSLNKVTGTLPPQPGVLLK